jgi:hypothetical protein
MWATHNLIRIHLFCCAHGKKHIVTYDVVWEFFISIARDVEFHILCEQTHFCLTSFFLIIVITNGYCVYNKWYLHFGRHSHCWFNLCTSYFASHFLLNSCENCSLSKGCVIWWSMFWKWFHSSNNKNIWIFTSSRCEWLSSLMCQHDMVDKRFENC